MSEESRPPEDPEALVARVAGRLKARGGNASDDMIERAVRDCMAEQQHARIKDFVPLLVERSARDRLRRMDSAALVDRNTA